MTGLEGVDHEVVANVQRVHRELNLLSASTARYRTPGNAVITSGRIADFYLLDHPLTTITFPLRGKAKVEVKYAGRNFDYVIAPGGFSILPGWGQFGALLRQPVESLSLTVKPSNVVEIVEREHGSIPAQVEFLPTWHRKDPTIVDLGQAFAAFLRSPYRRSLLYAESLWTQIVLKLLWSYSSLPNRHVPEFERLSDARVRRVIEFMQSSLAEDISLSELAEVASLSPNYFLNAFRKATGKTPHRYRTELRIERVKELLRNPRIPIIQIAISLGYSSQSHMTTVFRRVVGVTPAAYRAEILDITETDF